MDKNHYAESDFRNARFDTAFGSAESLPHHAEQNLPHERDEENRQAQSDAMHVTIDMTPTKLIVAGILVGMLVMAIPFVIILFAV
ncbi:hypothetical protein HYV71_02315 [Candidatus Uhrbacteria bacterium]|nr:hypothetical protein [Candidatus Uhrbacteria bacterium]